MSVLAAPAVPHRTVRVLGYVAALGALVSAVVVLFLDVVAAERTGIDPLRRTISEYGLTDDALVFNAAVLALAVGCAALWVGLVVRRDLRPVSLTSVLWVLGTAGLVVLTVFPKHDWSVGPSTSGNVHRVASLVAFLAIPVAVLLLTAAVRRRTDDRGRRGALYAAAWLAVGSLAWFSVILVAIVLRPVTGLPWWQAVPLGLVERGIAAFEVAAVLALTIWSLRPQRSPRAG